MISLRRHIDAYGKSLTDSWRAAYTSALAVMARAVDHAVPMHASSLQQSLDGIGKRIDSATTSTDIASIANELEAALVRWGENATSSSRENLDHLREIINAVATSATAIADRDQQYKNRFTALTDSLQSISRLDDLKAMRQSVVRSAAEIKICAEKMAEDGERSVSQLRSEIAQYRSSIGEYRRLSSTDPLTGIANRLSIDQRIEERIAAKSGFCMILIDLNEFKQLNDTHGHSAGDDLLKQFASELSVLFRASDLVGRWGGDEFVVVVEGSLQDAGTLSNLVRTWAFGDYKISQGADPVQVRITGAIGIAAWNGRESAVELFNRADKAMYADKESARDTGSASLNPPASARAIRSGGSLSPQRS